MTMWALWNGRNRFVFEGIRDEPTVVVNKAASIWTDFCAAAAGQGSSVPLPRARWQPPCRGTYKINVDGAIFADHHCVGFGVIIRDWEGQPIAAASKRLDGSFSATLVEAMAFRFAVELAHDLGLQSVTVEGDNLEVVQALATSVELLSPLGLIVEDILHDAAQFFSDVSFSHIQRDGNMVAHGLARHARFLEDLSVWMEDVPACVRALFLADLTF
ncbi:hypothetical protein L1049_025971 [Liquidambar formosana]|uniref:RNase H type-1 domain-containing protein n=1 Tax=Liquidambar formosana TaxID=63359 RepID=A0AAP0NBW0_LIQFO